MEDFAVAIIEMSQNRLKVAAKIYECLKVVIHNVVPECYLTLEYTITLTLFLPHSSKLNL